MCPPAFDPPAGVVLTGRDKLAIMYLERLRHEDPLPDNTIYLNPYQYKPDNLPGEMWYWYLVCSTEKKGTAFGFWREKEAASEIFTTSAVSCWSTTLEFIEILDARERRTNWVMQEYKMTEKAPCSAKIEKESKAICIVFLSGGKNSNLEVHPNTGEAATLHRNDIHSVASVVPRIDTVGSTTNVLVNNGVDSQQLVSEADSHLDPQIKELHRILDGDYLELDDLADPLTRSTSSDNSGRTSFTLDDYFDAEALLLALESKNNKSLQANSNSSCSVTASAKPFEVLMRPATSGSVVCASERQPAAGCTLPSLTLKTHNTDERVPDHTVKTLKPEEKEKKGDPSCSKCKHVVASSSNSGKLVSRGKTKAARVKIEGLKKYFCFMPM